MRWWCSALLGVPWSWRWQAYPGIWLFVLALAVAYAWAVRRVPHSGPGTLDNPADNRQPITDNALNQSPISRRDVTLFALGLLVLWIGADWPVGVLAAGYLLSVKTLQYLLLGYVAPALMLLGTPRWVLRRLTRGPVTSRLARWFTRPLLPLAVANAVLVATHLPVVVDNLSRSQVWTFVMDLAVIGSGFIFWWPALARLPELHPMSYGARIGYLGLNLFVPTVPASFFTFSQYPIYALYELAPRVNGIAAVADQRVAGILMKLCGGAILFGTMSVMFFRWYRRESASEPDALRVPG